MPARVAAPGASVLGLSDQVLAWRTRDAAGTDRLLASTGGGAGHAVRVARAARDRPPGGGRHDDPLPHRPARTAAALLAIDAASGAQQVLRSDPLAQITNPSTDGTRLLYVHATGEAQQLRVGPLAPARPATPTP